MGTDDFNLRIILQKMHNLFDKNMQTDLKKLFNPKSIAVIGASEKEGKVGNVIAKNVSKLGYTGKVFWVNPKHQKLFDEKCYKSVDEINEKIDLAIVIVPAKFVKAIVESAKNKVKNFVIISAGFAEIGSKGRKREEELLQIAKKNNLNILGPNCLGFISPKIKLNASFAGGMPKEGGVSIISQSGALAVAILDMANKEQFKFSQIISVGNKMQLSETELIEFLGEDDGTKVIAVYAEGIKDGRRFIEVAQKVSLKKPIVILKAGRSERAQKAISSHTGALAGSDKIMDVAFKKAGIIRANDLEEFFALIKFISNFKQIGNLKTAILTNAGGPGVLTTDNFQDKKIELAEISPETKKTLQEFLPEEASEENPIDLLGDADEIRYSKALNVLQSENLGNILCLMTAQDQTPTERIAEVVVNFSQQSSQNIIPVFIGGEKIKNAVKILQENELPNFEFPKKIVDVLDKIAVNEEYREEKTIMISNEDSIVGGKSARKKDADRKERLQKIISNAKSENRKALLFAEASEIMRTYDIPVVNFANIEPPQKGRKKLLKIGRGQCSYRGEFPVVLKVDSDKVLHKTDRQGLILGIKNEKELKKSIDKMRADFPQENLIVQPMIELTTELILGLKRDDIFGSVIVFGLGGIYTEVFKMVDFLLPPLSLREIEKEILNGKIGFLFKETRGKKIGDIKKMAEILFNFGKLAQEQKEIKEIDINPLLIDAKGDIMAVDVKIII